MGLVTDLMIAPPADRAALAGRVRPRNIPQADGTIAPPESFTSVPGHMVPSRPDLTRSRRIEPQPVSPVDLMLSQAKTTFADSQPPPPPIPPYRTLTEGLVGSGPANMQTMGLQSYATPQEIVESRTIIEAHGPEEFTPVDLRPGVGPVNQVVEYVDAEDVLQSGVTQVPQSQYATRPNAGRTPGAMDQPAPFVPPTTTVPLGVQQPLQTQGCAPCEAARARAHAQATTMVQSVQLQDQQDQFWKLMLLLLAGAGVVVVLENSRGGAS